MRRSLWTWIPLIAAVTTAGACKGTGKDGDDTDSPTADTETGESGASFPAIDGVSFSAMFGYDPETDSAVTVKVNGNDVPPSVTYVLGTKDYFTAGASDEGCRIILQQASATRSGWATLDAGITFGYDIDMENAEVLTDCQDVFDPADIDDAVTAAQSLFFFAGVHRDPSTDTNSWASGSGLDTNAIIGGWAFSSDAAPTAEDYDASLGLALGYQVDDTFNVTIESSAGVPLSRDDMIVGSALGKGWYNILLTVWYNGG